MDKGIGPELFVNDGSFMEKFKQFQKEKQDKEASLGENKTDGQGNASGNIRSIAISGNKRMDSNTGDTQKSTSLSGKLAFSLKQKSKLAAAPVKFVVEEEDETDKGDECQNGLTKKPKVAHEEVSKISPEHGDVAPPLPTDPSVKKVAEKLASFVAKNGRQFEHITRQRNPGDTPFKFLFDLECSDYKYYEYRLREEEKILSHAKDSQSMPTASSGSSSSHNSSQKHANYQIPASALYEASEERESFGISTLVAAERTSSSGEAVSPLSSDPIAMMEFYMKKAAQEERKKPPRQLKDEMPPPASFHAPVTRGHHMGDYIPQEELEKFLSTCNDVAAQRAAREAAEKAKIQADNIGHKLLSKMGWKEGEGLGSSKTGRADPVMAGNVKLNNLGVGAQHPGEVTPDDDIYEQYKKRMMLGYRYRPNPLNNPRKAYY